MKKIEYKARCHCGKLRWSFKTPEITEGMRCNCSMCSRKGALMSVPYIPAEDFTPISNTEDMTDYRWNDRVVNHLFCKNCGIYPYHGNDEYGYRVNLGCVEGLDIFSLKLKSVFDGRSMTISENPGPNPSESK